MTLATGGRRMSRTEVIERARGIAAAVAPQVARAEQLRRMPPENVTAMMGSRADAADAAGAVRRVGWRLARPP